MKKEKDYSKSMFKIFFSYFGAHKKFFAIDMGCALLTAAVDIAYPLISRHAMYDLLPENAYRAFFTLMAIVIIAYVIRAFLKYIVVYIGHRFGAMVETDIRRDLFRHMQTLDFDFYDQNRTGVLMSRVTSDLFEVTELAHHGPEDVLISCATIIGALIAMFNVEWRLALVVMIVLPVSFLIVYSCRGRMTTASRNVKVKLGSINSDIESTISGMKTSKAFDNGAVGFERFDKSNMLYRDAKVEFQKAMGVFGSSLDFFLCFFQIAVLTVGGYLIMGEQLNYIDLIMFMLYITTFVTPIRNISTLAEMLAGGIAGLRRFIDVMRTKPTVVEKEDAKDLDDVKGKIELKDVRFSYNEGEEVLHGVSLDIKPGECVALVGHSGGGKSTISKLIPRFYDVDSGSITIDGIDLRDLTKSSIRKYIGIVQQDVFLFADTIFENIKYGKPSATYEEVIEAAKRAEIYDDIMNMPQGFDTYVGERGTLLSGGQKQRVAIARIFLKNPPILILDEATSALDSITEALIQESFKKLSKGRTTVMIAHRLATIKDSDRIVVVDGGNIIESGTHDELMALDGVYKKLYETQRLLG
ncbi:MAG: ABC transporter ATP-binding protein/permease [Clostridia bacterium]|nr:ABC transporter ATP-binding protein/permease [Clostridia bacterium]